jgi:hypothetical protein
MHTRHLRFERDCVHVHRMLVASTRRACHAVNAVGVGTALPGVGCWIRAVGQSVAASGLHATEDDPPAAGRSAVVARGGSMARLSGRLNRYGRSRPVRTDDSEEGRFCANAILCFIGWILIIMGLWYLQTESERAPKVHKYNDAVREWNITHRAEFETASFRVAFAQCAACTPHLTLDLEPSEAQAQFGVEERGRQGPNPDISQ